MNTKSPCTLLGASNVSLPAPTAATLGAVRVTHGARALLVGQTAPAQNGIYAAGVTGAELVTTSQVFDGDGQYAVSGLSIGAVYRWTQGGNTSALMNDGTLVATSGWFVAAATTVVLEGEVGQDVTDSIKAAVFARAEDADAADDWELSFGVNVGTALYFWERPVPFALGTTEVAFSGIATTPATAFPAAASPTTNPAAL